MDEHATCYLSQAGMPELNFFATVTGPVDELSVVYTVPVIGFVAESLMTVVR